MCIFQVVLIWCGYVVLIIDEARDCGFLSCVVIHQYVDFITIDMH